MISTGLQKLDGFLLGGIPNGIVVDIFGANGTGKTQLLLQLTANTIKNNDHVLYLDTTGEFRPERILELQTHADSKNILDKITVSRITNTFELIKSLDYIETRQFSLIVIDSITDLFSFEYKTDDSTFEKNLIFMKFMRKLSQLAIKQNVPIVISNMVRTIEGKETEYMKNAIEPFTHIKIHLSKTASKFKGTIYWALKKEYFYYQIHASGFHDITEDI